MACLVQVAGEDLDAGRVVERARVLDEQHGHGIGFLARGAGRAPDAHGVLRPLAAKSVGMMSRSSAANASRSRKKFVTEMSRSCNSAPVSPGCVRRKLT